MDPYDRQMNGCFNKPLNNLMLKIFKQLLPLFVVQFFTWIALFALWIYATPVITHYIFNSIDSESPAFKQGISWVGFYFAFYSCLAAFLAFAIPFLLKKKSKEKIHGYALLIGGIGLLLIFYIKNRYLLFFSFAFIGIAWSSISNLPYRMISSLAPEQKMTTYFSVFNFSVVIPQVTAAFILGYIADHYFKGETIYLMLFGGCSMLLAGLIMLLIPRDWLIKNAPPENRESMNDELK